LRIYRRRGGGGGDKDGIQLRKSQVMYNLIGVDWKLKLGLGQEREGTGGKGGGDSVGERVSERVVIVGSSSLRGVRGGTQKPRHSSVAEEGAGEVEEGQLKNEMKERRTLESGRKAKEGTNSSRKHPAVNEGFVQIQPKP